MDKLMPRVEGLIDRIADAIHQFHLRAIEAAWWDGAFRGGAAVGFGLIVLYLLFSNRTKA